jgi:aminoglycoside phosphotransferase family enzyme
MAFMAFSTAEKERRMLEREEYLNQHHEIELEFLFSSFISEDNYKRVWIISWQMSIQKQEEGTCWHVI